MELVKSGVTDMEEKVIHLINLISLIHLVHFIKHINLTDATDNHLIIRKLHWFASPAPRCLGFLTNWQSSTCALCQLASRAPWAPWFRCNTNLRRGSGTSRTSSPPWRPRFQGSQLVWFESLNRMEHQFDVNYLDYRIGWSTNRRNITN